MLKIQKHGGTTQTQGGTTGTTQDQQETETTDKLGLGSLDDYRGTETTTEVFKKKLGVIFAAIRTIGIVLSVVILIIIGLKYMLGSVEEKADYKKTLIPYLWGTFFIFSATYLPQLIYDIVKDF